MKGLQSITAEDVVRLFEADARARKRLAELLVGDSIDKRIDALDKRIDHATKVTWTLTATIIATLLVQLTLALLHALGKI